MPEKLEFESESWVDHIEREKEKIIDDIAVQLARERPELFEGRSADMDLVSKVRKMSEYLDDEAIAEALKLTPETVRDILEGKAEIREIRQPDRGPVVHVSSVKTAYRQKIVSVCRAKGGVGCSMVSLGLAYSLSREIKTLLIDLNLAEGGGDLSYYLNLPEYPHMGVFNNNLEQCSINVEPNLYVLQAPRHISNEGEKIDQIIGLARQDFDAVVIDLPNFQCGFTAEAMRQSNTLVAVTGGMDLELVRLAVLLSKYQSKHVIIAANRCELPREAMEVFADRETVKIEHDGALLRTLERCDLPGEKSVFMRGIEQLKDAVFEREKRGILKRLFG